MSEIKETISKDTVATAKALETYKYGFTTNIESVNDSRLTNCVSTSPDTAAESPGAAASSRLAEVSS